MNKINGKNQMNEETETINLNVYMFRFLSDISQKFKGITISDIIEKLTQIKLFEEGIEKDI